MALETIHTKSYLLQEWSALGTLNAQEHFKPHIRDNRKRNRLPRKEPAPSIPEIPLLQSSVMFLERLPNGLSEDAPSGVFHVRISNMGECILKIFHGVEEEECGRSFSREAIAYASLLHCGVSAAGVVPHCYGKTTINQREWHFPKRQQDWLLHFRLDPLPLKALILEYFPHASKMTLQHITCKAAEDALNGLKMIHEVHVLHGDIHPRNILALPNGRIVWVDFENASTWPHHKQDISKWMLEIEYALAWNRMYGRMLPWKWSALKSNDELRADHEDEFKEIEEALVSKGAII